MDQTQSFNEKLSQWIASQGFWFQLRHSISGGGGWSMTFFHLFRLGLRVLIVVGVLAAISALILVKRTGTESYIRNLEAEVGKGLSAELVQIAGFNRSTGEGVIQRMVAKGGGASFFDELEAGNVRFRMGLFDDFAGSWDAGVIKVKSMSLKLKAGADGEKELEEMGYLIRRQWPAFKFTAVEAEQIHLYWGYSTRTAGRIEGSRMEAIRTQDGWRVNFRGGYFTQNWLRDLEIEELAVECRRGQLSVVEARFRCGSGSVRVEDLTIATGVNPKVSGKVKLSRVDFRHLLPDTVEDFVEGQISGDFTVSGSTNSPEGVTFDGRVRVDGQDGLITLREDRVHLLKALSVVDAFHSYRKVEFETGGFRLRTAEGGLQLSDVELSSGELLTLHGELNVRPPTVEETREAIGADPVPEFGAMFNPSARPEEDPKKKDELSRAMKEAAKRASGRRGFDEVIVDDVPLTPWEQERRAQEALAQEAHAREVRNLRYEGSFKLTLSGDAFDRAERLKAAYPKDAATGRIPLVVPVRGSIYDLTHALAEDLLRKGQR